MPRSLTDAAASMTEAWPATDLEPVRACPLCGTETRSLIHADLRDRIFGGAAGTWTLWRCLGCSAGYLDPRPTRESIGRAYRRYFRRGNDEAEPQGLRAALVNGYLNGRYGYAFAPANAAGRLILPLFPFRRFREDVRVRHLRRAEGRRRVLDAGFGGGEFLRLMARAGWDVAGLETDESALAAARSSGLHVERGTIEDAPYPDASFDVVTLSHVVEHLHDPIRGLRECARLLRPGGELWLATPNLDSPGRRRFGDSWFGLDPPRHLVLFTIPSLDRALALSGFDRVRHPRSRHAGLVLAGSEALARGSDASTALRPVSWRLRALAFAVDTAAVIDPRWGEELIAVANVPGRA